MNDDTLRQVVDNLNADLQAANVMISHNVLHEPPEIPFFEFHYAVTETPMVILAGRILMRSDEIDDIQSTDAAQRSAEKEAYNLCINRARAYFGPLARALRDL